MSDVHVVPLDDLIDHEPSEECVCGPAVEPTDDGFVLVHYSLDGREFADDAGETTVEVPVSWFVAGAVFAAGALVGVFGTVLALSVALLGRLRKVIDER